MSRRTQRTNRRLPYNTAEPTWANDLRVGAGAASLFSWHRAENNITLSTSMAGFGSSPPTVTLGGTRTQPYPIRIDCDGSGILGTATFRWSLDEYGSTYEGTGILTSGSPVALGTTGATVTFGAGTYTAYNKDSLTGHKWQSAVESWSDMTGRAGCIINNSAVVASTSCLYERYGINGDGFTRASILGSPGILGNQSALATMPSGAATPFHAFCVAQVVNLPTLTNTLALFGWQSTTQAAKEIIDLFVTGPTTVTVLDAWGVQRINTAATIQRVNSTQADAVTRLRPDIAPHVFEMEYTGTTVFFRIDGTLVGTVAWSGSCACDRFPLFGLKLAGGAAGSFLVARISDFVLYSAALSASDAASVRLRLA